MNNQTISSKYNIFHLIVFQMQVKAIKKGSYFFEVQTHFCLSFYLKTNRSAITLPQQEPQLPQQLQHSMPPCKNHPCSK